jgi:hypothetical protein
MIRLIVFFIILSCTGCVTTEFYSKLNPQYQNLKFQRILVKFVDLQPDYTQFGEQTAQSAISIAFGSGVQCYLFSDQFYTGLKASREMQADIAKFEQENNIDALLICLSSRDNRPKEAQYYVPPAPGQVSGYSGSVVTDEKIVSCRLELFDLHTKKSVWFSQARLDSNSILYTFKSLLKIFVNKSVDDLKIKGVLGKDDRPVETPGPVPESPKQEI